MLPIFPILPMLTSWWGRVIVPYLAAAAAAVALVFGLLMAGRREGRQAAERRALNRDLEIRETRDAVDRVVAREPDASLRLRDKWSRD
jgi:hypothetical protein